MSVKKIIRRLTEEHKISVELDISSDAVPHPFEEGCAISELQGLSLNEWAKKWKQAWNEEFDKDAFYRSEKAQRFSAQVEELNGELERLEEEARKPILAELKWRLKATEVDRKRLKEKYPDKPELWEAIDIMIANIEEQISQFQKQNLLAKAETAPVSIKNFRKAAKKKQQLLEKRKKPIEKTK